MQERGCHVGRECSPEAVAERLVRPSGDAPGEWRHHRREGGSACPWRMLQCADPCQEHTVRLWYSAENTTAWVDLISNPWRLIKSDENQVFSSLLEIELCLRWSRRCTCYSGTNMRSHTKSDKETTPPGIKSLMVNKTNDSITKATLLSWTWTNSKAQRQKWCPGTFFGRWDRLWPCKPQHVHTKWTNVSHPSADKIKSSCSRVKGHPPRFPCRLYMGKIRLKHHSWIKIQRTEANRLV